MGTHVKMGRRFRQLFCIHGAGGVPDFRQEQFCGRNGHYFKELLTAVAGLKKEENGDEYEK